HTYLEIRSLYKSIKPDLVHHVAMKPVLYGSLAALTSHKPAVVNAMIGLGYLFIAQSLKAKILRPIVKQLLRMLNNRKGTRLLLQNRDDQKTFTHQVGVSPEQTRIIRGSGVDVEKFSPTPEPAVSDSDPIKAKCLARMLKDKGLLELIDAARILKARKVNMEIQLVGPVDDNPASLSQEQLDKWQDEGIVKVLGPRKDIAELNRLSHIAVLPSYREGLPKSLLEAAACGRPLVATNVPGCREICVDGQSGILVPVKTSEPLADALQKLAENAELRQELGKNARKLVENQFSERMVKTAIVELYAALLN
ncbi:MAG: glycosyltransferase family 4 protein, partial [Alphaproteobacteria bacterium]|nr:glycosyltransferase family 4 protein [Alphaproteobacteria bacterium]